ncbi:MAG: ChbG/HpnK family deacetylase [Acidobacteria bacterium]|nr:ChbG/HpnK family deacetylase [Acidobacteriota bacterium]
MQAARLEPRHVKVIVNADDLGISTVVNDRIFDLLARGHVTSATVLANGPAVDDAARRLPRHAGASFGVHLNLTEFAPLTPSDQRAALQPLLDDRGCFAGESRLQSTPLDAATRRACFIEWCLQIRRVRSLGIEVSHLDSHNHVHTMPALFPVLKRVQREFGVRRVRGTWNLYPTDRPAARLLLLKKRVWSAALRRCYRTATTDVFTSFAVFHDRVSGVDPGGLPGCASIELMVHPGAAAFETETQLLEGRWREALRTRIELITYRQLG